MATTAHIVKSTRSRTKAKYSTRIVRRCWRCGRKRGYMRKFDLCRICFREFANKGEIPGIIKASWS
ncbi:MAG: type Z 30S ribosomal protein S14 [Candidatus Kerfeldbacteria bacterium]|nr:type Z 30S ribosomal protein S14 [Candidatus Kerfeldbacteria bacterium]